MRRLRIAAPAQLKLDVGDCASVPLERWWALPEDARELVVRLLARMIERSVVVEGDEVIERSVVVEGDEVIER